WPMPVEGSCNTGNYQREKDEASRLEGEEVGEFLEQGELGHWLAYLIESLTSFMTSSALAVIQHVLTATSLLESLTLTSSYLDSTSFSSCRTSIWWETILA